MKLLIKDRGVGKTTGLIYTSESTGFPIVTNSKIQAAYIKEQAENMGCEIPEPITVHELQSNRGYPPETNILFDNIETILEEKVIVAHTTLEFR